jgi:hypothetical protein
VRFDPDSGRLDVAEAAAFITPNGTHAHRWNGGKVVGSTSQNEALIVS